MEKSTVSNGNKLIAEFMELISVDNNDDQIWYQVDDEYILNSEFRYKNDIQYTTVDMIPYNVSWDWLMPVIEKIMDISLNDKDNSMCDMDYFYLIRDCIPDINNTYCAVVEFIKWYNENKK